VDRQELDSLGAYPEAAFFVEPSLGYSAGNGFEQDEFMVPSWSRAGHGYLPSHPEMYTGLIASGLGIRRGVVMQAARQIDIAPTVARLLGFNLPSAEGLPIVGLLSAPLQSSAQK
jgi:hypothetical protein